MDHILALIGLAAIFGLLLWEAYGPAPPSDKPHDSGPGSF